MQMVWKNKFKNCWSSTQIEMLKSARRIPRLDKNTSHRKEIKEDCIMNSLRRLLIINKIAKIVSYVLVVCFLVGAFGTILGLSLLHLLKDVPVETGKTLEQLLLENKITFNACYVYLSIGLFSCLVGAFLAWLFAKYCKEVELQRTYFTRPLLKGLRRYAIIDIATVLIYSGLCGLAIIIARAADKGLADIRFSGYFSVLFGLILLLISLFIEYAIEREEANNQLEQPAEQEPTNE